MSEPSGLYDSSLGHVLLRCRTLSDSHMAAVLSLWNSEYPIGLKYSNTGQLQEYLDSLKDLHHLILLGKKNDVNAWYFDFIRGDKRWFAMILHASIQGKGYGSSLLNLAKQENRQLNGWVIDHNKVLKANGELYSSPLQFYLKNNFMIESSSRLELDYISAVQVSWSSP